MPRALHRVRSRSLLGEVHDGVGLIVADQVEHDPVVLGDVEPVEGDLLAADLTPRGQAHADRPDRRQRVGLKLKVSFAPSEVVDDRDVVATGG